MGDFKTVDIRDPNTFVFVIGACGTSSQIPDVEKWCSVPNSNSEELVYVKEFIPGYDASSLEAPFDLWKMFGLVIVTVGEAKVFTMAEVVDEHGTAAIMNILWKCMGTYRNSNWISQNIQLLPSVVMDSFKVDVIPMYGSAVFGIDDPDPLDTLKYIFDEVNPHRVTAEQIGARDNGDLLSGIKEVKGERLD